MLESVLNFETEVPEFTIVMGTKRLVENGNKAEFIQADATYKLTFMGYPLLVAGFSDKAKVIKNLILINSIVFNFLTLKF